MEPNASGSPVPSDADLLSAVRAGDESAYAELYNRHVGSASAAARSLVRSKSDADDLVSEAFTRVLRALRGGGGPELAFRPYLLTAVRNAFYDRSRKDQRVEVRDEVPEDLDAVLVARAAMAGEDRELVARAFANLPERWQTVLWHTEVEGRPPAEVAPMLGIAPNAVAALAYRAREGLREAYLQAHLQVPPPAGCAETRNSLGGYVRDSLSNRDRGKVEQHLDGCDRCRSVLAELREVSGVLRVSLLPVLLGVPAATYLHHLAAGGKGIIAFLSARPRGQQVAIGGGVAAGVVAVAVAVAALGGEPAPPQVASVVVASTTTVATTTTTVTPTTTTRAATTVATTAPPTSTSTSTSTTAAPVVLPTPTVRTTTATTRPRATTTTTTTPATTTTSSTTTTTLAPTTTTTTIPPARAALRVVGSPIGPVVRGQRAYFSLVVSNAGPDAGRNTLLSFTLPAALQYVGAQGDGWSCTSAPTGALCARSTVDAGASSTVLVETRVDAAATGTPTMTVTASSDAIGEPGGASANVAFGAAQLSGPSPLYAGVRRGDIAFAANTLRRCEGAGCATAQNNNGVTMVAVDVDTDATTSASSSATLTLPAGALVNRAWLVWGATSSTATLSSGYTQVRLTGPDLVPVPHTAALSELSTTRAYGRVDVTGQVRTGGSGVYTFASVGGFAEQPAETNRSGGWSLVVQYDLPSAPLRTLVVLDGLVRVDNSNQEEVVALGLLGSDVPATGVTARIGLVAWDGDRVTADTASLTSGATPTTVDLDPSSPNDVFDSTIEVAGVAATGATPAFANTFGFDADQFDVTVRGGGALTLTVRSVSDAIELGLITMSVPA